jgi:hypothetical protein
MTRTEKPHVTRINHQQEYRSGMTSYRDWLEDKTDIVKKRNDEIFPDKVRAYICYPYSDKPEISIERTKRFARMASDTGYLPFAPQLYYHQFMVEKTQRSTILSHCLAELYRSDVLFVFGIHISDGMKQEIDLAEYYNIPVYRFFDYND